MRLRGLRATAYASATDVQVASGSGGNVFSSAGASRKRLSSSVRCLADSSKYNPPIFCLDRQ